MWFFTMCSFLTFFSHDLILFHNINQLDDSYCRFVYSQYRFVKFNTKANFDHILRNLKKALPPSIRW